MRLPAYILILCSLFGLTCAAFSSLEGTFYCKCICFSNYTIQPMYRPTNPSKPCLTCTKQWCLDQKLPICANAEVGDQNPDTATGKEGDIETRCFQRDSPRDQMIVTLFLLMVIGLLIGAAVKSRMEEMGIGAASTWSMGRTWTGSWWERLLPSRQTDRSYPLGGSASRGAYDQLPGATTN